MICKLRYNIIIPITKHLKTKACISEINIISSLTSVIQEVKNFITTDLKFMKQTK